jgi:hypothetical protein
MPQLHLYISKEIAAEVKRRAEAGGMSVSRYLAELVRREVADEWPDGFFDEVVGGWRGEPLERPVQLPLEERDALAPNRGATAEEGDKLTPNAEAGAKERDRGAGQQR